MTIKDLRAGIEKELKACKLNIKHLDAEVSEYRRLQQIAGTVAQSDSYRQLANMNSAARDEAIRASFVLQRLLDMSNEVEVGQ